MEVMGFEPTMVISQPSTSKTLDDLRQLQLQAGERKAARMHVETLLAGTTMINQTAPGTSE